MSITLTTIDALKSRAQAIVSAFASWSVAKGTTLVSAETTNRRLRGYATNVAGFAADCAAIEAATGYSSLPSDIRTDISAIASAMSSVSGTIASLIDPDDHFSALDSTRQSAIVAEIVAAGIASDWSGVPADLKADLLQHEVVDATTVTSIVAAVTIA